MSVATYLADLYRRTNRKQIIDEARKSLPRGVTLVGTGLSGTIAVSILGYSLNKPFAIVRKDLRSTHSYRRIEGAIEGDWVFVDDLIDSGATKRRVLRTVRRSYPEARYVGDFLYLVAKFYREGY
jgi:orotate phosphoribosyltransferase